MSYILDALKKSQQEREAQTQQGEPLWRQSQEPASNLMPLVWLLALVVGLLVVLYLWVGASAPTRPEAEMAAVESVSPLKENKELNINKLESIDEIKSNLNSAVPSSVAVAKPPEPAVAENVSPEKVQRRTLPPLSALKRIPALQISSHIYSALPEKRSVTMNNRVWQEGESIVEGVVIDEITPNGLQLSVDGWPLSISRQQGWQPIEAGY